MAYKIVKQNNALLFGFQPEGDDEWLKDKIDSDEDEKIRFKRTFYFTSDDVVDKDEYSFHFSFGVREDDYYHIEARKLNVDYNVFIACDAIPTIKWFVSERNVSHFHHIFKVVSHDIYIGGNRENAIPMREFESLINRFPGGTWELDLYVGARIEAVVSEYYSVLSNYRERYEKYLDRKTQLSQGIPFSISSGLPREICEARLFLYQASLNTLQKLIVNGEATSEADFQKHIVDLLCLIFPQYILALPKVRVPDEIESKNRELDYMLVDVNGNVDVVEIKKAFSGSKVIREAKYRDNYLPAHELSGAVMQVEKYIHHLRSWGSVGEKVLTKRYEDKLPDGIKLRFVKTKGIVIIGKGKLDQEKQRDFDLIRRQYEDVIDILTYEDFESRLERIIAAQTAQ